MSRLSTATSVSTSTSTDDSSIIRRSWHAMSDLLSPFSPAALAKLPKKPRRPSRYTRADEIPDVEPAEDGEMPSVRDYHSISAALPHVRVPKKTPTPVRVESKVWFANERSMYTIFFFYLRGLSLASAASLGAIQTLTDSKKFQHGSRISICLS
jgi:hypothetical protein